MRVGVPRSVAQVAMLLMCLVVARPASAEGPEQASTPLAPAQMWIGVTAGLPVPIGGILGLQVHRRLSATDFAEVGISSAAILTGTYVTWGHRVSDNGYTLLGVDTELLLFAGDDVRKASLAGIHGGYGWEWFLGPTRTTLALCAGFPWLGGLRLGVAL